MLCSSRSKLPGVGYSETGATKRTVGSPPSSLRPRQRASSPSCCRVSSTYRESSMIMSLRWPANTNFNRAQPPSCAAIVRVIQHLSKIDKPKKSLILLLERINVTQNRQRGAHACKRKIQTANSGRLDRMRLNHQVFDLWPDDPLVVNIA